MQIDKDTAKKLYPAAEDWFKKQLEEEFGKETFIPKEYEKIDSYETAVSILEVLPEDEIFENDPDYVVALKQLRHITRVANPGFICNWNNSNQKKWIQIFDMSSGAGFVGSVYDDSYTITGLGSRLYNETKEVSDFIGINFNHLFKIILTK